MNANTNTNTNTDTKMKRSRETRSILRSAIGTLALAACLGLPSRAAAQNQPVPDQQNQNQSGDASAQLPDATAPPQDGTAPPANAAPQAGAAAQDAPPQTEPPVGNYGSAQQSAAPQGSVPQTLTLPAGTTISVRLRQWLSSDQNHAGDTFSAELDQPIVVDGWVVGRRGQSVLGRVVLAQKAGHGNTESKLGVELAEITLVDGTELKVSTELVQDAKARSQRRDAATVGATTAVGAIIGGAAGGGSGAAIGAAAGIGAGIAAVMATPGRPTVLRPEQLLMFRLESPADVNTERGHVAFRPVAQGDYGRDQDAYGNGNRPRLRYGGGPYPYAPYGAYPPPAPYYYNYYPGPFWGPGFYGGVVFGPRIFIR